MRELTNRLGADCPVDPEGEDGFAYPKDRPEKLPLCRCYLNALGKWWGAAKPDQSKAPGQTSTCLFRRRSASAALSNQISWHRWIWRGRRSGVPVSDDLTLRIRRPRHHYFGPTRRRRPLSIHLLDQTLVLPRIVGRVDVSDAPRSNSAELDDGLFLRPSEVGRAGWHDRNATGR